GVEVADGGAVLAPTGAGDRPGGEQQGLGEGGLAGSTVADERHVADLRRRKCLHVRPPGLRVLPGAPQYLALGTGCYVRVHDRCPGGRVVPFSRRPRLRRECRTPCSTAVCAPRCRVDSRPSDAVSSLPASEPTL